MGSFSILDYAIVIIYVVASLAIGLRYAGRQKSAEDYFVANRSARSWAVALSAIATGLSAISYLGVPAWVFQHDLQLNAATILLPVMMLGVVYIFVPLLARMRLLTIYQYLEHRFSLPVRTLASAQFLVLRGGWLATAIYTQSLLLQEISGLPQIPQWGWVAIVGALTACYTILGGMEAVLWTDVMQFFVLVGGLLAILAMVLVGFGGNAMEIWRIAAAGDHTRMIDLDFSFVRMNLWGIVCMLLVDTMATYGSDQVMVQRFLTTRSPSEMRRSVMLTGLWTVPIVFLLMLVGLCLVAYYQVHPELSATLTNPDRVVPHFVRHALPMGVAGLVIAGVFAATMSTLSAGFNSLATATVVDFIQRFGRPAGSNPAGEVRLARSVTFAWAAASTVVALFVGRIGTTIVEIFGKISGLFAGPILGVFLLGILTRRTGPAAALLAFIIAMAFTFWVAFDTEVSWLWYGPTGCLGTILLGCILAPLFPRSERGGSEPSAAAASTAAGS